MLIFKWSAVLTTAVVKHLINFSTQHRHLFDEKEKYFKLEEVFKTSVLRNKVKNILAHVS